MIFGRFSLDSAVGRTVFSLFREVHFDRHLSRGRRSTASFETDSPRVERRRVPARFRGRCENLRRGRRCRRKHRRHQPGARPRERRTARPWSRRFAAATPSTAGTRSRGGGPPEVAAGGAAPNTRERTDQAQGSPGRAARATLRVKAMAGSTGGRGTADRRGQNPGAATARSWPVLTGGPRGERPRGGRGRETAGGSEARKSKRAATPSVGATLRRVGEPHERRRDRNTSRPGRENGPGSGSGTRAKDVARE
jgi:hypothetical protein